MKTTLAIVLAIGVSVAAAVTAHADPQPSARDIQAAVDDYLARTGQDTTLVGGPGGAGYDSGFWISGGKYSLRLNMLLQARYEAWVWDDAQKPNLGTGNNVAGNTSGFSLPRATLRVSGTAPCNVSYYVDLEFGHFGRDAIESFRDVDDPLGPGTQSLNFDYLREAWLQWSPGAGFNVRVGQIRTATTRQAMITPDMQQFVDVSLATAFLGWTMPGYTDRNRDHGIGIHGTIGCKGKLSYLATITNGDGGDSIRNVLDVRTSDNLAYSGRVNWAFLNSIGWQEGALRQWTRLWYGEVGAWAYYYGDRADRAHVTVSDSARYGADLALGYGGFSFTGAYSGGRDENASGGKVDYSAYLAQLGYHFPGTAWEIAGRWDMYDNKQASPAFGAGSQQVPFPTSGQVMEFALGVNYYLNGHGNKLQLDVSWIDGQDAGSVLLADPYTGYPGQGPNGAGAGEDTYGMLFRFQWQVAL